MMGGVALLRPRPGTPTQLEAILAHPELAALAAGITALLATAIILLGDGLR